MKLRKPGPLVDLDFGMMLPDVYGRGSSNWISPVLVDALRNAAALEAVGTLSTRSSPVSATYSWDRKKNSFDLLVLNFGM
jgi:hypothetical protein